MECKESIKRALGYNPAEHMVCVCAVYVEGHSFNALSANILANAERNELGSESGRESRTSKRKIIHFKSNKTKNILSKTIFFYRKQQKKTVYNSCIARRSEHRLPHLKPNERVLTLFLPRRV